LNPRIQIGGSLFIDEAVTPMAQPIGEMIIPPVISDRYGNPPFQDTFPNPEATMHSVSFWQFAGG